MIYSTELRIGNWCSFKGLFNEQITEIGDGYVNLGTSKGLYPISDITPIQLKPEMIDNLEYSYNKGFINGITDTNYYESYCQFKNGYPFKYNH